MKINWGCGSIQPDGWINVDNDPGFLSPFRDMNSFNDVDIIVAHCSLQMVEFNKIEEQLKEFYNHLKTGGALRISLPDIAEGAKQYFAYNIDWFPNSENDIDDRFSAWLTWYSTTITLLTVPCLLNKLLTVGFKEVCKIDFKKTLYCDENITDLDTRQFECYFVDAIK